MKYFICISIWVLGMFLALSLHYSFITNHTVNKTYPSATHYPHSKTNTDTYYKRTTDLFLHNLFVAFLISIGGIVTAGSLSIIVLFYNGFLPQKAIAAFGNHQIACNFQETLLKHHGPEITMVLLTICVSKITCTFKN